jgi:hypothetical protein
MIREKEEIFVFDWNCQRAFFCPTLHTLSILACNLKFMEFNCTSKSIHDFNANYSFHSIGKLASRTVLSNLMISKATAGTLADMLAEIQVPSTSQTVHRSPESVVE